MKKSHLIVYSVIITTFVISGIFIFIDNYEILSNEELINITNNVYIRGALSIAETGNIPYIQNGTIQTITIEDICNLNKQKVQP